MIQLTIQKQILSIWDKYIADNKKVIDSKGNDLENIDEKRLEAIVKLKIIIDDFLFGFSDIGKFKIEIDSFNKQNNFWGFTSIKGQMFFNLLLKNSETEEQIKKLTKLLQECITEPKDLSEALSKIEAMDKHTSGIFNKAPDKRKAPNPGSVCYFLSYFWQIHNYQKWPVMFSSIIVSFTDIGLWLSPSTHQDAYNTFFNLNEEIKQILTKHIGKPISNWEAEHCFWNFRTFTAYPKTVVKDKEVKDELVVEKPVSLLREASFNISDYLPPITAKLVELGGVTETTSASKGSNYEKAVVEVFRQLGFTDVVHLGQGKGNEPDIIIKHRTDGSAFIIDAKGYSAGYNLSTADDRAIRDYISRYCAKLHLEGIRKIGFIIVSNSFKDQLNSFIDDITWNTDIRRFKLVTSDALLHLLAYRFKGAIQLQDVIDAFIDFGNIITKTDIIEKFDNI